LFSQWAYDQNHVDGIVDELKDATQTLPFVLPHPLQRLSRLQNYDRGQMLFRRGDAARSVFFLYSGEVRMLRSGRAGEDILLHRARPGEYFAEAAVDCSHYLCDAIVSQASTLAVIPKGELAELIRNDGGFARQWNSLLAHELRTARERIERLALSSVAERVRHFIISNGRDSAGVALSGSLKDLARDLGVTHEALYRTLASMQKSGEIDRQDNILKLASPQRGKLSLPKERRSAPRGPDSKTASRLGDRRGPKV
jgi:CRP/FNR family transcriptional regulator, dissimilatory nitrate respiration regulator